MTAVEQLTADVVALRKQRDAEAQLHDQVVQLTARVEQGASRLEGRLVEVADAVFEARAGVRITWSA